jgi:hypothetical protein
VRGFTNRQVAYTNEFLKIVADYAFRQFEFVRYSMKKSYAVVSSEVRGAVRGSAGQGEAPLLSPNGQWQSLNYPFHSIACDGQISLLWILLNIFVVLIKADR